MTTDVKFPSMATEAFRHSTFSDIYIPIAIVAVPPSIFTLLGFITAGLDKPGAIPPLWVTVTMIALQTLGIVAMAFVILVRFEFALAQLSLFTNGHPPVWRKLTLILSIVCLLLFDIFANVSAAFAGAGPLLGVAVPIFFAYVLCKRVAFAGLPQRRREHRITA